MEYVIATFFNNRDLDNGFKPGLLQKFREHIDSAFNPVQFDTLVTTRGLLEYEFYIFCYEYTLNSFIREHGRDYGKKILQKTGQQKYREYFKIFFDRLDISSEEIYNEVVNNNFR